MQVPELITKWMDGTLFNTLKELNLFWSLFSLHSTK